MIASPHIVVGALIGKETGNWFTASLLATLSHVVLDALPHPEFFIPKISIKNIYKYILIGLDILIGIFLAWLLVFRTNYNLWAVISGIFFAIIIDTLDALPLLGLSTKSLDGLRKLHDWFQNENVPFWLGALCQILIILFVFFFTKFY